MNLIALSAIWAGLGLLVGGLVNVLADDLPARIRPQRPHCPRCNHRYTPGRWLAIIQYLRGGVCPDCALPTRRRALAVELGLTALFALLPWLIQPPFDLVVYSLYVAILVLVIVIDSEHRLVLHVVTFPTTAFALAASIPLADFSFLQAIVGAVVGFIFFFLAYLIGERIFGRGALGFGDVTLAMMMGAMLGFQRIFFALIFGILLAGLWGVLGLLTRRFSRQSHFAYGPFLAIGGLIMILWGNQIYNWATGN